jgi:hypothetical protein
MMSAPTPETISISITESGSTTSVRPAEKPPAESQVHAVVTSARSSVLSPSMTTKTIAAATNEPATASVEMNAAARRETHVPPSVMKSAAPSGAASVIQEATIIL